MNLTSYLQEGTLMIALTGEIDHHCAKKFISAISGKIEAYSPRKCTLDFRDVTFMDSSGIAIIINALRQMKHYGGELLLSGLRDQPMKVIRLSGVDRLVRIKEEVS